MKRPLTWDDIITFDDIIVPEEKEIILDLEKETKNQCPYLKKKGKYFYYCSLNLPEVKDKKPEPSHPVYQRHVGLSEMQLHCLSEFENCCFYSGKLKR